MSAITVFYQACPVCGRSLRIPTKFFGREMSCTHCEGQFRAGKDEIPPKPVETPVFTEPVISPLAFVQSQLGEV